MKNVLITGGSSGLGRAIVETLCGSKLYFVFFTYKTSLENVKILESTFSNCKSIYCDFENEESVNALVQQIPAFNLDVLINNAYNGTFINNHFHKIESSTFEKEFITNIIPVIKITQQAIKCFREKKIGKVITVLTSALHQNPPIGTSIYLSNKAYLQRLCQAWAQENVKFNITSNTVSPSFMQTNFTKEIDERIVEQIKNINVSKELLSLNSVAESILKICCTDSDNRSIDIVL